MYLLVLKKKISRFQVPVSLALYYLPVDWYTSCHFRYDTQSLNSCCCCEISKLAQPSEGLVQPGLSSNRQTLLVRLHRDQIPTKSRASYSMPAMIPTICVEPWLLDSGRNPAVYCQHTFKQVKGESGHLGCWSGKCGEGCFVMQNSL